MINDDNYYAEEAEKLQSIPNQLNKLENSIKTILNSVDFLIKRKNLKNYRTEALKTKSNDLKKEIEDLISDPYLGDCPYNDPTLDHNDPYYMKPPFGKTPEQLKKLSQTKNEKHD